MSTELVDSITGFVMLLARDQLTITKLLLLLLLLLLLQDETQGTHFCIITVGCLSAEPLR